MNAVSNSDISFSEENAGGSDTDSIPEESPEYYEPLSNGAIEDEEEDSSDNEERRHVENGISYLDMSKEEDEEEEEKEEEEERMRREAMQMAFREDERRRSAPLTQENTTRVMEAMRGISFRGLPPDWAAQDHRWMDQLAAIRQSPSS
ncbi:hypothetical protein Hanom_Chr02g00101531 [Helianthus anomalus]